MGIFEWQVFQYKNDGIAIAMSGHTIKKMGRLLKLPITKDTVLWSPFEILKLH